jgi:excinuclease ABC subunit C
VSELRPALASLQRVFRFRTCKLDIQADDDKRRFFRPCLLYHIRRCTGPCADRVDRGSYGRQVHSLGRFLDGQRKAVLRDLSRRMEAASKSLAFEEAATLRDMIRDLENLAERGVFGEYFGGEIVPADGAESCAALGEVLGLGHPVRTVEGVDIALIAGSDAVGSVVTFVDGRPFRSGYRRFRIKTVEGTDDVAMIGEVLSRRFRRIREESLPVPDVLLVDGGAGQVAAAVAASRAAGVAPARIAGLAKKEERIFLPGKAETLKLPRNSPALQLLQCVRDEAHRFARHYHHILRRKSVFGESEL